jgi:hypothetical protein
MKNYIIFEIDKGVILPNNSWIKHSFNLWKITYSWDIETRNFSYGFGAWGYGFYGGSGIAELPSPERFPVLKVGSLVVDVVDYVKVDSIGEAETQDRSFYFDTINQILYVNFSQDTTPFDYQDIALGVTKGYSNFPIRVDNIEYESRLRSIPSITTSRDALFFGKVQFEGGGVTLDNTDHHFDTLEQEDVFGKVCRIRYSLDGTSFQTVYTGKFQDYQLSGQNITINIRDQRKGLLTPAPFNTFSTSDYPNIADNTIGSAIPFGFGIVKDSLAYCLEETLTQSTYDFKFCDTEYNNPQSIQKVKVDGRSVSFTPDITNGEFTLSSSVYTPGSDVTVDYTGYDTTNPLDIISFLLDKFLNIDYNSNFYNITHWELIRDSIDQEIGLGIVASEPLVDIIGRIAASIFGMFIVDGDGRYNFKVVDNNKSPAMNLYKYDYMSSPTLQYKGDEYISSCKVYYDKGVVNQRGPQVLNRDSETNLFTKYDFKVEKEFDTLLTSWEDALDYSNIIMDNFGGIFPTWTIVTKLQTLDLEIEDLIDAWLYKQDGHEYPVRLEIIGKTVDYLQGVITLTCRFVSYPQGTPPINIKIIRI